MTTWFVSLSLGLLGAGNPGESATIDLTKVERTIHKEPRYKTKTPRYCLLVFGPKADHRVWLVLDGSTLYVDRNGNGDLTEPGESTVPAESADPCGFKPITIVGADGKTEETLRFSLSPWFDYRDGKDPPRLFPIEHVSWKGREFGSWGDETGPCIWGRTPRDAPILHVDGPLQMGFETDYALERKGDGEFELSVGVGTRGLGKGAFVHLGYANNAIPKDVFPTAVLEFPSKTPGGPPVRVKAVLKQRC